MIKTISMNDGCNGRIKTLSNESDLYYCSDIASNDEFYFSIRMPSRERRTGMATVGSFGSANGDGIGVGPGWRRRNLNYIAYLEEKFPAKAVPSSIDGDGNYGSGDAGGGTDGSIFGEAGGGGLGSGWSNASGSGSFGSGNGSGMGINDDGGAFGSGHADGFAGLDWVAP
eukprot:CAMPEP_0178914668 /NCGR_PEP_ID=MMETSP0786-20121207/11563_1 /TAXON_ID=186022 /ORGANISM="Thalassionema frauenfeldii, Strain CCMP 1798" /LENGTH=169 /DNA_ID=CAMNT_0020587621 /DNA_START=283 /DNA_END=795 /DNA_ORIENTATION=+